MKPARKRVGVAIAAALASVAAVAAVASPHAQAERPLTPPGQAKKAPDVVESSTGSYIVVMQGEPLVTEFGQQGLDTAAAKASAKAKRAAHAEILAAAGVPASQKLVSYSVALDGFAATMSFEQAQVIAAKSGVAAVFPNELRQPMTDASGDFLGLSGETGVWATEATGDGVLVGIIDSGIWPEHPSLDPASFDGTAAHGPATDYVDTDGTVYPGCEFGTDTGHVLADGLVDEAFSCNDKLIGARQVMPTYEAFTGLTPVEYDSARDEDGHGTHTATTAAGNAGVTASILDVERGVVTGIAPDAQVIVYKALGTLGGYGSDLALAIDIAVADGVDVINYSIGSSSFAIGPDDVAFFFATLAGVHVATSNGNSGPGPATIGSPASVPWLTSVGANTHDRTFQGAVTLSESVPKPSTSQRPSLGDATLYGASVTAGTDALEIVDAAKLNNELCLPDVPFRGQIEGRIVLCKRGAIARIDKSLAVGMAGGAGMILYNENDGQELVTDTHWVPSVHVNYSDGLAIKEYIKRGRQAVAAITGGEAAPTQGSVMAAFSSRGENRLSADIIKPDVTAPGVNILAGQTPTPTSGPAGQLFQSISGTSMSSPHVAGLMALMTEVHPLWSPGAVKSALMTTARQNVTKENGVTYADPFDMGAGHVDPPSMLEPGLVYDTGALDYLGSLCGLGLGFLFVDEDDNPLCPVYVAAGLITDDLSQYNQASIASGALPGSETVVRTVTNVTGADITVNGSFDGLDGMTASMSPASLTVPAGGSASYAVTFTNVSAPLDEWTFGSLTLSDGNYSVYSPIALRPVQVAVADEVSGEGETGSTSVAVDFGYTGEYTAGAHGLVAAVTVDGTVFQDDDNDSVDPGEADVDVVGISVPDGSALLRVVIPPEVADAGADIDIFLADPSGTIVAASTNGGTDELIDVAFPAAGDWTLYVQGWAVDEDGTPYTVYSWAVPAEPNTGSLVIDASPASATIGTTGSVDLSWTGATLGEWHLGAVSHSDGSGLIGLSVVSVDNR